jgi:O-antigen/teichoic acid export membrane protein
MNIFISKIKGKGIELKRHMNKDIALMLIGNLLTIIINIATVKILTNKYTTADFGIYSLIISFTGLPQLVLFAPIAASIFPYIKNKKNEGKYEKFQKDLFDLFFLMAGLLMILLLIMFSLNIFFHFVPNEFIYLVSLSLAFSSTLSWLSMLDTFSLANFHVKEYTVFPMVNLVVKLGILGALFKIEILPQNVIVIFSVFQFIFCFIELKFLKKNLTITQKVSINFKELMNINSPTKREILNYSKNFFIWGLFGWGQTFFDKWFLNHYNGSSTVGIYAVYYQYGFFPFTIFSSIISQYITPLYFSKVDNNESALSFLRKLLVYCVFFLIIFCTVMFVLSYYLAPFFIKIFTNAHYLEYINLFPIIVLAGCFYGFGQIITVPLLNSDFVGRIRFPKIATAIIAVILFWILVPLYGLIGILSSLLLSNVFYFTSLLLINVAYVKKLKAATMIFTGEA